MKESDLHIFIDSALNYFREVTQEPAEAGIPYLKDEKPVVLEFSGIIGISGRRKGSVYLTTSVEMLKKLGEIILGSDELGSDELKDLVGEVANTISGNARKELGPEFMISVPVVVEGSARDIKLPSDIPTFVIPLRWKKQKAYLVICLE
jgi:chemotaxis protein CheX